MYLLLACHHWQKLPPGEIERDPQLGTVWPCPYCPPDDESNPHATAPWRELVRVTS